MDKFFKLKENHTTVRTEILAGITTFMAMAYILMVNAGMFGNLGEGMYNAVYIATAISAVIGTLLIGLMARLPLAQASAWGLNAFFVYTVCFGMGFSYANALVMVLVDGIVFILLTVTGLRRIIFEAIPKSVKTAISAGIGLFHRLSGAAERRSGRQRRFDAGQPPFLQRRFRRRRVGGHHAAADHRRCRHRHRRDVEKKIKGAVFWGIIGAAVLYYVLGLLTVGGFYDTNVAGSLSMDVVQPFRDFFDLSFLKVFTEGFDFSAYIAANGTASFIVTFLCTMLAFCMVDMFDTLGTLFGACSVGGLLDEEGNVPRMEKAMLGGRHRHLRRRGLRHFHRYHVCGILPPASRKAGVSADVCILRRDVLYRYVLSARRRADSLLRHGRGPDLCRYPYDRRRQEYRLG